MTGVQVLHANKALVPCVSVLVYLAKRGGYITEISLAY